MAERIQLRRDTETNWATNDPVLCKGEPGYDETNDILKIGDGETEWSELAGIQGSGTSITNYVESIEGKDGVLTLDDLNITAADVSETATRLWASGDEATESYVDTQFSNLEAITGLLTNLTTEDKSNLVASVNEVNSLISAASGQPVFQGSYATYADFDADMSDSGEVGWMAIVEEDEAHNHNKTFYIYGDSDEWLFAGGWNTTNEATDTMQGTIQLSGDLGGSAQAPAVTSLDGGNTTLEDINAAISDSHTHDNKSILDLLDESSTGELTYNGNIIEGGSSDGTGGIQEINGYTSDIVNLETGDIPETTGKHYVQDPDVLVTDSDITDLIDTTTFTDELSDYAKLTDISDFISESNVDTKIDQAFMDKTAADLDTTILTTSDKGVADGVAELDSNQKIPLNQLPDTSSNITYIRETISERDSITDLTAGDKCYVRNDGDTYIYDNDDSWTLMAAKDWANVELDWSNINGKPTSLPSDIDAAVDQMHEHSNKATLDTITETPKTETEIQTMIDDDLASLDYLTPAEVDTEITNATEDLVTSTELQAELDNVDGMADHGNEYHTETFATEDYVDTAISNVDGGGSSGGVQKYVFDSEIDDPSLGVFDVTNRVFYNVPSGWDIYPASDAKNTRFTDSDDDNFLIIEHNGAFDFPSEVKIYRDTTNTAVFDDKQITAYHSNDYVNIRVSYDKEAIMLTEVSSLEEYLTFVITG